MPVQLQFDANANVQDAIGGFQSLVAPLEGVGTAAAKADSGGGGLIATLGGGVAKVAGLLNPMGLLLNGAQTLGPALLNAGKAAGQEQTEIQQLTNTVKNAVPAWDGNTQALDDAVAAAQRKAFSDSEARASLAQLATDTGDVNEAIRLQGLAMDLSASKGISLQQATNLLGKADDESYAALAKLGIEIEKGTSREDALAAIHAKTAGAADIFAQSAEGAGIRLQASLGDAVENVGTAVLPLLTTALSGVADFLSGPTFQSAVAFVSDVLTNGLGAAVSFVQGLIGPFTTAVQPLVDAIIGIGAGAGGAGSAMDGFKGFLDTAQQFIINNVIPVVGQLASFLATNLPSAITAVSGFWTSTLQPAIAGVWDFVSGTVFPIIGTLLNWLAVNLPPAIQGLADFWTTTLQPAISQAWTFVQTDVFPVIQTLFNWVSVNLPPAIQGLANFWTQTLQPAISQAWNFVSTTVFPIIASLFKWLSETIPPAIQSLANFWTQTLQPALSAVWDFIDKNVLPILGTLIASGFTPVQTAVSGMADFWQHTLQPALSAVWGFIKDSVIPTISGLADSVGKAVSLGADLINGILKGLQQGKDDVINFIKGIAAGAVQAIKDFFGIKSPSTLMAGLFGPNGVTGGMVVGLQRGGGAVLSAARGLQGQVAAVLTPGGGFTLNTSGGSVGAAALAGTGPGGSLGGGVTTITIPIMLDNIVYGTKVLTKTSQGIQERADMQTGSYRPL